MKARPLILAAVLLFAAMGSGCVERRFVITSDPPGAVVYDGNGVPLGATPVDKPFTYYGVHRFTLVKDGYKTAVIEESIKPPWYQVIGLDFISENLVPCQFRDVRRLGGDNGYPLEPAPIAPPPQPVLEEGTRLRERALLIGPGLGGMP